MTHKPRIIIHSDTADALAPRLRAAVPGAEVACCGSYDGLPDLVARVQPDVVYSICFAGRAGFPRDALLGPDGPEWIAVGGSGVDHLGKWDPARVTVTNSSGVAAGMMAEYAFGAFLHFSLDLPGLEADRIARRWPPRMMVPLAGKTLLIVGLGQTGQAVAARARAFGMRVIGTRARPEPMENVDAVYGSDALDEVIGEADFVVIATPLVPSTRGMINAERLAALKPTAVLVDVSRGGVVDPVAMHAALAAGRIRGAALDVFPTEPLPADDPLWGLDNVILSPHCSSVFDGWDDASFDMFLGNLARWQRDEPLHNVVDPALGY